MNVYKTYIHICVIMKHYFYTYIIQFNALDNSLNFGLLWSSLPCLLFSDNAWCDTNYIYYALQYILCFPFCFLIYILKVRKNIKLRHKKVNQCICVQCFPTLIPQGIVTKACYKNNLLSKEHSALCLWFVITTCLEL